LSIVLASCTALDPDYAEYKKLKEAQTAGQSPYGQVNDFGVPGGGLDGAPYQPLPTVHNAPPAPAPIPPLPDATPGPGVPPGPSPTPAGNIVPHTVAKGDSLWGLAKRYGTTIEAIQAANGLAGTDIQAGRTLQIPSNN
jgi:membrane-bound lytic murein transglycosylase D